MTRIISLIFITLLNINYVHSQGKSDFDFFLEIEGAENNTELVDKITDHYLNQFWIEEDQIILKSYQNLQKLFSANKQLFGGHCLAQIKLLRKFERFSEAYQLTNILLNKISSNSIDLIRDIRTQQSVILMGLGYSSKAIKITKKLLIDAIIDNKLDYAQGFHSNLALLYSSSGNGDSAVFHQNQALELENRGVFEHSFIIRGNMALDCFNKGDFEGAVNAMEYLLYESSIPNPPGTQSALAYLNLGIFYQYTGQTNHSLALLDTSELLALNESNSILLANTFKAYEDLYFKINENELAQYYKVKYDSIQNRINLDQELEKIKKKEYLEEYKINQKNKEKPKQGRKALAIWMAIITLIGLLIAFFILKKRGSKNVLTENVPNNQRDRSEIDTEFLEKINTFLIDKKNYKDPKITIKLLAQKLKSNTTTLSNIINDHYEMPFRSLINKLRIEEAKKMFQDEKFGKYSIEGISRLIGYKSVSSFNNNFKKIIGQTPSEYLTQNRPEK